MLSVDHQRETLFGLVIGDLLGAAVEFEMPGTFLRGDRLSHTAEVLAAFKMIAGVSAEKFRTKNGP